MAACSQFHLTAAPERTRSRRRGDVLPLSGQWWFPWTCSFLAHQLHLRSPRRLRRDPGNITPRLASVQHHQPPDGQHFQRVHRDVHRREPDPERNDDFNKLWVFDHSATIQLVASSSLISGSCWCSDGVKGSPVVVRASDSLWMFSTALCAVVGVMVVVGVAYQIHLDRVSKRKKLEFQSMKADRGRHPLLVTHRHCWVHFKIRYGELRVSPIGQLYSSIFQQQSLL